MHRTRQRIISMLIIAHQKGKVNMILKPRNREEWLAMRLKVGIGGSEAGCVLGLNPWKSNLDLYREKIGEV